MVKNKLFGATLIVAGAAIGAGMLPLPLATYSLGLGNSAVLMVLMWVLGYYASIIALKINLVHGGAFSISELCRRELSPKAVLIADLSIITLFYSLISAYISGIVEISLIKGLFNGDFGRYIRAFIVFILVLLTLIDFKAFDLGNRIVFLVKVVAFCVLLVILFPQIRIENIGGFGLNSFESASLCRVVPLFFTSFGFHGSIPFIIKYLDRDEKQVKKAFFRGSLLSLVVYLLWILFTVLTLPKDGAGSFESVKENGNNLGDFVSALASVTGLESLSYVVTVFSWLAIITSFLGVGVGLYDYFLEKLKLDGSFVSSKIKAGLITFVPPIIIVVIDKDIFIKALAFAAVSLSVLAVILPSLIALKISKNQREVFFKPTVIAILLAGCAIVMFEMVNLFY